MRAHMVDNIFNTYAPCVHTVNIIIDIDMLLNYLLKKYVTAYNNTGNGNTGTSTLNKMYTADLIHSACVELKVNVHFQHAALEFSVDSEFLLSGRLFLCVGIW